jgi:hypothetical protein
MADRKEADFEGVLNPKRTLSRRMSEAGEEDPKKGVDKGDIPGPNFDFFKGGGKKKDDKGLEEILKKRK